MSQFQLRASEVVYGDVIMGPDGPSTVSNIETDTRGVIKFSFAEGKGDRGWSGIPPNQNVLYARMKGHEVIGAFLVNDEGQVTSNQVAEVIYSSTGIKLRMIDNSVHEMPQGTCRHIAGNFVARFT